ncbi:DNA-directed RNA polymerase I subunit rpa49 [Capsicum chacoense]
MAKPKERKKKAADQSPSKSDEGKNNDDDTRNSQHQEIDEAKSIKKMKKKKQKHTVTMETIAENPNNISPIVGYFPSGYDPLKNNNSNGVDELSTKLYRNVKRNNRLQLVVSPNGSQVDFVGTNYSGEAASAQLCTYSLGVFDKGTRTLNIVPIAANKILRLEPRVRGSDGPETEDADTGKQELTAVERDEKLRGLTHMYSSKKSIRQAEKLDSLRQQEDTGNQEEFDRNIAGVINKDALEVAVTTDNARNTPPYDLAATTPQLAYPLERIISNGEWDYLLDVFKLMKAGAEMTPDAYPSFVCNRSYKLEHIQDEDEKKRLAGIFSFITHLVKFKDKHSMDGVSSAKHHKIPGILFQKFSSMFAIPDSKRLPEERKNLLINYVLVLTLFADDFRTDLSDIAKDLRMNAVALRPHYEYLGCKLVREKNVLLATLPVPLTFPDPRRKRRR